MGLLVEGMRAKDIAVRLQISPKTVDTYRSSLMRKLGIETLAGLVKFSVQRQSGPRLVPAVPMRAKRDEATVLTAHYNLKSSGASAVSECPVETMDLAS